MCSDCEPQKLPPATPQNKKAIEQPKRDCRHHEQVHRGNPISMVTKEVLHPCGGGTLLRTIYLATLVCPTSMPSFRSSPWILGAPHNGLAPLIWRISWRISTVTAGRPQRCFDFHRQYDLNPPQCQRITVSGRTIATAPYILGKSRQTPPNINLSIETNRSLLGLARRSTLICCLSTRISASSATCDRNRSLAIAKINRHKSSIGYQHRAILSQLPARLNLRQGQAQAPARVIQMIKKPKLAVGWPMPSILICSSPRRRRPAASDETRLARACLI